MVHGAAAVPTAARLAVAAVTAARAVLRSWVAFLTFASRALITLALCALVRPVAWRTFFSACLAFATLVVADVTLPCAAVTAPCAAVTAAVRLAQS
ncbi:MAG TPA: hypothetical protein DEQ43_07525 [Nocardioides bacterium]|nr:hypothetical protein [Nocardioides sp.]